MIWGILTAAVMTATVRFYLPYLSGRKLKKAEAQAADETAADEAAEASEMPVISQPAAEKRDLFPGYERKYFRRDGVLIFILVLCSLWAGFCGYMAAENAASLMSLLKMSLGMLVLACVFFTDLELLTIPNLCSLVLLGGRAVSVLAEFLIMPETAVSWLLNSLIALAVSFAVLYLMNRITGGGIGMGDVKLYSSLGFLCGVRAVVYTLLFSFLLCAVLSVILILTKKKTMKDSLPMGPFIWAGYGLAVILGVM